MSRRVKVLVLALALALLLPYIIYVLRLTPFRVVEETYVTRGPASPYTCEQYASGWGYIGNEAWKVTSAFKRNHCYEKGLCFCQVTPVYEVVSKRKHVFNIFGESLLGVGNEPPIEMGRIVAVRVHRFYGPAGEPGPLELDALRGGRLVGLNVSSVWGSLRVVESPELRRLLETLMTPNVTRLVGTVYDKVIDLLPPGQARTGFRAAWPIPVLRFRYPTVDVFRAGVFLLPWGARILVAFYPGAGGLYAAVLVTYNSTSCMYSGADGALTVGAQPYGADRPVRVLYRWVLPANSYVEAGGGRVPVKAVYLFMEEVSYGGFHDLNWWRLYASPAIALAYRLGHVKWSPCDALYMSRAVLAGMVHGWEDEKYRGLAGPVHVTSGGTPLEALLVRTGVCHDFSTMTVAFAANALGAKAAYVALDIEPYGHAISVLLEPRCLDASYLNAGSLRGSVIVDTNAPILSPAVEKEYRKKLAGVVVYAPYSVDVLQPFGLMGWNDTLGLGWAVESLPGWLRTPWSGEPAKPRQGLVEKMMRKYVGAVLELSKLFENYVYTVVSACLDHLSRSPLAHAASQLPTVRVPGSLPEWYDALAHRVWETLERLVERGELPPLPGNTTGQPG